MPLFDPLYRLWGSSLESLGRLVNAAACTNIDADRPGTHRIQVCPIVVSDDVVMLYLLLLMRQFRA